PARVDRDDARAGEQAKELDRIQPQAADADDDSGAARPDPGKRRLDCAVCRDAGIGEGRGHDRVQAADRYEVPGLGDEDVGRVPAVVTHSRSANALLVEAVVLFPGPAHVAAPAARPG